MFYVEQDLDLGYSWCAVAVPPPLTTTSVFEPVFPVDRQTSTGGGDQRRSTPAAAASSVAGSKPTATGDVQTTSTSTSSLPLSVVTEGAFCEARVVRKVEWPRTAAGGTVVTECPNNKNSECYSFSNFFCARLTMLDRAIAEGRSVRPYVTHW